MAFENHARTGLVERASRIALKHGVVYNARTGEFRGDTEGVTRAKKALDHWMSRESSRLFRDTCS